MRTAQPRGCRGATSCRPEADTSVDGFDQARQHPQRRRLAGAVRSEQREDLARARARTTRRPPRGAIAEAARQVRCVSIASGLSWRDLQRLPAGIPIPDVAPASIQPRYSQSSRLGARAPRVGIRCTFTRTATSRCRIELVAARRHEQAAVAGEEEAGRADDAGGAELHRPHLVAVRVVDVGVRLGERDPELASRIDGRRADRRDDERHLAIGDAARGPARRQRREITVQLGALRCGARRRSAPLRSYFRNSGRPPRNT